jgi:hypothetical protein
MSAPKVTVAGWRVIEPYTAKGLPMERHLSRVYHVQAAATEMFNLLLPTHPEAKIIEVLGPEVATK